MPWQCFQLVRYQLRLLHQQVMVESQVELVGSLVLVVALGQVVAQQV
jgi:hypothetical protein